MSHAQYTWSSLRRKFCKETGHYLYVCSSTVMRVSDDYGKFFFSRKDPMKKQRMEGDHWSLMIRGDQELLNQRLPLHSTPPKPGQGSFLREAKNVQASWKFLDRNHSCDLKTTDGILIYAEIMDGVWRYFLFDIRFGGAHLDAQLIGYL